MSGNPKKPEGVHLELEGKSYTHHNSQYHKRPWWCPKRIRPLYMLWCDAKYAMSTYLWWPSDVCFHNPPLPKNVWLLERRSVSETHHKPITCLTCHPREELHLTSCPCHLAIRIAAQSRPTSWTDPTMPSWNILEHLDVGQNGRPTA